MEKQSMYIKELSTYELSNINGGLSPWIWVAIGYVVSEVAQGIYQAEERGCLSSDNK